MVTIFVLLLLRPQSVKGRHVKTAYIRLILRIDVFEEFAIDYNLTAHILDMVRDI